MKINDIVAKLDTIMPGFMDISSAQQEQFVKSLASNRSFLQWLEPAEYSNSGSTFASRQLFRQSKQNNFKQNLLQLPSYDIIVKEILKLKIQNLGLNLDILEPAELEQIFASAYSKIPFPENWLDLFLADPNQDIQSIHQKLFNDLHEQFGFLFLTQKIDFFIKIKQSLNSVNENQKKEQLIKLLDKDWAKVIPFLAEFTLKLSNTFSDWLKPWIQPMQKYLAEMMRAHQFYRMIGVSSDNVIVGTSLETGIVPFVNFLDYYNYHTNRKWIDSMVNVWQTLFKPLRPFFYEYVELAQSEKNIIKICIRAFMPFWIMSMVLALGYAAILPLAYHQLIEYIFFIPALYFSIIAASQYIQLKNYLYLNFIQWYFGSVNMVHFYDENISLMAAIPSKPLAHAVLNYYINALEVCDAIEHGYSRQILTKNFQKLISRHHNLEHKKQLLQELDTFNKTDVEVDGILSIIQNRLSHDEYQCKWLIKQNYLLFPSVNLSECPSYKEEYLRLKQRFHQIEAIKAELASNPTQDLELNAPAP
jgi:hypothetical protein